MASSRKAAVGFIFITLLVDVMGWGLIIPVMPDLIAQLKNIPVNEASPYGAWFYLLMRSLNLYLRRSLVILVTNSEEALFYCVPY